MTQISRFWNGTTVGDAIEAPYDAPDEFASVLRSLNGANANSNRSGVCRGELNTLTVTAAGGVNPISVASGRAFVHGTWFESDAAVSFNVGVPTNNQIHTVVLSKNWLTQQVRLAYISGPDQVSPTAPVVTQSAQKWEFPLYNVLVAGGTGAITLTDVRQYVPYLSNQVFEKLADTTLLAASTLVSFTLTSTQYRMYIAVVNSQINTAIHSGENLGLYFTPTINTEYDYAAIQTFGTPYLSHSTPGLYGTWCIDVGNVGQSAPYANRSPQSIIFMTNLHDSLDKNVFALQNILSDSLNVAISAGTFKYALPVTGVNFCIIAGDQFKAGSRFTLYGVS